MRMLLTLALASLPGVALAAEPEWGRVIVMVNDATGAVERNVNYPKAYGDAWAEDRQRKGFRILMTSTTPGFGATFCVSRDIAGTSDSLGRTLKERRVFYSHPHATVQEAIGAARTQASAQAAQWHEYPYICGQPWEVTKEVPAQRLNAKYVAKP